MEEVYLIYDSYSTNQQPILAASSKKMAERILNFRGDRYDGFAVRSVPIIRSIPEKAPWRINFSRDGGVHAYKGSVEDLAEAILGYVDYAEDGVIETVCLMALDAHEAILKAYEIKQRGEAGLEVEK